MRAGWRAGAAGAAIAAMLGGWAGGALPGRVVGAYCGMSGAAFMLYLLDKRAARAGARRTRERTLHLVGLLGGWPGGLLAQDRFQHKTRKTAFQAVFWTTVALNCAVLALLLRAGYLSAG